MHDKVPRESETQNPRLLSQQRYDDAQFLNDHHMHSFIEGSIPDKFQNDQMIRDGAESLAKRFFLLSCTFVCDKLESKNGLNSPERKEKEPTARFFSQGFLYD